MTLLELLIYKAFSKKTSIPNYKKDLNENPIFFKEIKETTHSLKTTNADTNNYSCLGQQYRT